MNFPATKQEIKQHVEAKSSELKRFIFDKVENLREGVSYNSVHEVEKDVGLVKGA